MPDWTLRRRHVVGADDRIVTADTRSDWAGTAPDGELPVLHALLHISQAVLRAEFFDEVLEVIAEQSVKALGAASVAISRWESDSGVLRTLINAGDLGPNDARWPEDEIYPVSGDAHVQRLLQHGQPYINAIDDVDIDPGCLAMLSELGRESEISVPVMSNGSIWGELWASGSGGRRFGPDDVQLLQAVAAHVAVAISRAELFSTVWRYAYHDPLTGLANRRALDQFFAEMDWQRAHPVLILCDLDGFKRINDTAGHPAGDALLTRVATVLTETASARTGSIVVRLGGDEFCVVLVHSTFAAGEQFAREASRRLMAADPVPITLSWGAADTRVGVHDGEELIAAADSALLEAKRLGRGWFRTTNLRLNTAAADDHRRSISDNARRNADRLVPRVVRLLDENRPETTLAALEIIATEAHRAINGAGWTISALTDDGAAVQTLCGIDSKRDTESGLRVLKAIDSTIVYPLHAYPATARALDSGGSYLAGVDTAGSDAAEVAMLLQHGYRAVLGIGVKDGEQRFLLEIFSDVGDRDLVTIAPHLRVLAPYCTTAAGGGDGGR